MCDLENGKGIGLCLKMDEKWNKKDMTAKIH